MDELGFELFYAQFKKLDLIKSSDKIEIYNVFDEETKTVRILKICKGKDLSSVCKSLTDIRHPNVAVVYDYVYYNGNTHILEEKLQGETLDEKLEKEKKLSPEETVRIVTKVCEGLSVLHAKNPPIIHNDIKPSNIFICDDGNIKIFDFDISRVYKTNVNHNTQIVATEAYASPAHYGYGQTDQRSDIYSLGVTIHKMLTGQVLNEKKESIYKGRLKGVINKCIQYDPKNTYKSTLQLKQDLEKNVSRKTGRFFAVVLAIIVCGALIFGAGLFVKKVINNDETQPPMQETDGSEFFTENNAVSTTEKTNENANTTTQPVKTDIKAVKVVSKTSGEVVSMVSLNDGTIVYLEAFTDECHIKTSTGIEKVLALKGENCRLLYNNYTNSLYMVYRVIGTPDAEIYFIDNNYDITDERLFVASYGYDSGSSGFFLSDGTLYSDCFTKNLIDSTQWVSIGSASFVANTQLNDRMFYINNYTVTEEKGNGSESVSYNVPWDYLYDAKFYTTIDGIYFIARTSGKDYIYKFDGDTFTELLCLNDYKYYTHSSYEKFSVTKDKIWLYDATANTIKELPVE